MKWRAISAQQLHFRSWGDEFLVYNGLSGDTHLLGPVAAQVLLRLQEAPLDAAGLIEVLAPLMQTGEDEALMTEVEHLLVDLGSLELIERA